MLAKDYLHLYQIYSRDLKEEYKDVEPIMWFCENHKGELEHVMCHPKDANRKISSFKYTYVSM